MNHGANDFIGEMVAKYPMRGAVLEIGSRDICGTPRHWFTDGTPDMRYEFRRPSERFPRYVGIDLVAGNAVDVVMDGHELQFEDGTFGVVVSTSQMEHDSDPFQTMREIYRVLASGGYLILTAPSWRGEGPHDTHDYWRFMPEGMEVLIRRSGLELLETFDSVGTNDVMAVGFKRYMNIPSLDEVMKLTGAISNDSILQIPECAAMYEVLCQLPDKAVVVEVGCDVGRSSSLIAQVGAVKDFLTIHIDPWEEFKDHAQEWMKNMTERCAWHRFIVLHMTTEQAAGYMERLIPDGVDFAFIDGCHDPVVIEWDLRVVAARVRSGGFLLAHDYPSGGPTEAFDPFIAEGGWVKYKQAMGLGVWRRI